MFKRMIKVASNTYEMGLNPYLEVLRYIWEKLSNRVSRSPLAKRKIDQMFWVAPEWVGYWSIPSCFVSARAMELFKSFGHLRYDCTKQFTLYFDLNALITEFRSTAKRTIYIGESHWAIKCWEAIENRPRIRDHTWICRCYFRKSDLYRHEWGPIVWQAAK